MTSPRILLAPRFRRSAQLEADVRAPDPLAGYVVSPLASEVALHLSQEMASAEGARAFSVVGPYGSGKSSFLTFLLRLWRWSKDAEELLANAGSTSEPIEKAVRAFQGPLVPAVVTGERSPIAVAVVRALDRVGLDFWATSRNRPKLLKEISDARAALEAGAEISDGDVVELAVRLAEQIKEAKVQGAPRPKGLVIVIDEMGKHLEYAALNPHRTDLYLLQLLSERGARHGNGRLAIITVLHQEMAAYAESLPRTSREEWSKVAGRFETVTYLESPKHLAALLAGALVVEASVRTGPAFEVARKGAELLKRFLPVNLADSPLDACFPIDPLTAVVVGPLFRRRIAQNERSLFAFLASFEPNGFQEWLSRADLKNPQHGLFRLPDLYDYVMSNLGVRGAAEPGDRTWAAAEHALARLPAESVALDARLVKVTAILTLLGPSVGLRAETAVLALAVGVSDEEVHSALERLASASIVIFRRFKSAWQLWDGSDLDVNALVERARLRVEARGGLADLLAKHLRPPTFVAVRHGYRTGALRVLVGRFSPTLALSTSAQSASGDGDLLLVFPDRTDEVPEMERQLLAGELAPFERPVVHALPDAFRELRDEALTFFAIHEALHTTQELESDPVARRELTERSQAAFERLNVLITTAYGRKWWWRGKPIDVGGRPGLAASRIFDAAYAESPCIRNELANRDELSSAAAAARRDLMERMIEQSGEPWLGITGHPPTLSMYRSVLEASGLHRPRDPGNPAGEWTFGPPPDDGDVAPAWNRLNTLVRNAPSARANIAALMDFLAAPPFGVRAGVSPILILAWVRSHADEVFWYEENTFAPTLTADTVHRLLRRPEFFEIQAATSTGTLAAVVAGLSPESGRSAADRGRAPLRLVRNLMRTISALPPYSQVTVRVSAPARRVRAALKSARDPVRLLLESLPEALELTSFSQGELPTPRAVKAYATALSSALKELVAAEANLHNAIEDTLARLLGSGSANPDFRRDVAGRAGALLGTALELPPLTRRLAEITAELDTNSEKSRTIWLDAMGTALLGKAPSQWSDSDLERFGLASTEPCRSFLAAEQLALELGAAGNAAVRLVRVSMLDNRGERRVGVGVLRAEEASKVTALEAEITRRAKELGLTTPGLVYAVLSGMMAAMTGTHVQVDNRPGSPKC